MRWWLRDCGLTALLWDQIVSLDGSLPPAFVQHLHMVDIPRLARAKPWLSESDIVMEELLNILHFSSKSRTEAAKGTDTSGGVGACDGAGTGAGAGAGAGAGVGAATHPSWREESWLGVRGAAAALGLPLGAMVKSVALVANGALVVRGCGGGGASRGRLVATLR